MITEQEFLEYAKANDYYVKKRNHNTCRTCEYFVATNTNENGTRGWGRCVNVYKHNGAKRCGQPACAIYRAKGDSLK